jgi:flagellar motor switch protein FliM
LPLSELSQLEPGAVINLRLPAAESFLVRVGEVPKFLARGGSANGRLAVQIVSHAEPPTEA